MKKVYITPAVEVVKAETSAIIAMSMGVSEQEVDTSVESVQLGRENQGLWDYEW